MKFLRTQIESTTSPPRVNRGQFVREGFGGLVAAALELVEQCNPMIPPRTQQPHRQLDSPSPAKWERGPGGEGRSWTQADESVPARVPFRPPGALEELAFLRDCTRCGDCARACPASAILLARDDVEQDPRHGIPYLDLKGHKACVLCDPLHCVAACEPEALRWREREEVRIARVELHPELCLSYQGVLCRVCADLCPLSRVAITLDWQEQPSIVTEHCTGCGACYELCLASPKAISIHPLTPLIEDPDATGLVDSDSRGVS